MAGQGIVTRQLEELIVKARRELTMIPFFRRRFDLRSVQEPWAMRGGFGGPFNPKTIAARRRGTGYYSRGRRPGVSAIKPFGVWSGFTLRSTYERRRIRVGHVTFGINLKRRFKRFYDVKVIGRAIESQWDRYLARRLGGRAA